MDAMRPIVPHRVLERLKTFVRSARGHSLAVGLLAGFYVVCCCHQLIANFGTGLPIATAAGFAIALAASLGFRSNPGRSVTHSRSVTTYALLHLGLAAWIVVLPSLIQAAGSVLGRISANTLASAGGTFLTAVSVAMLIVGVPSYLLVRMPIVLHRCRITPEMPVTDTAENSPSVSSSATFRFYLAGLLLGLSLDVFLLAPLLGVQAVGFTAALIGAIVFLRCIIGLSRPLPVVAQGDQPEAQARAQSSLSSLALRADFGALHLAERVWAMTAVACCGILTAVVCRMVHQLMPVASFLVYTQWASLLAGLTLGWFWAERCNERNEQPRAIGMWSCLAVAAWIVGVLVVFPRLVDLALMLNSYVSQAWLMTAARSLLAAVVLFPIGVGWGLMACGARRPDRLNPLVFVGGLFLARWTLLPAWGAADCLIAAACLLLALAALRCIGTRSIPRGWAGKGAAAVAGCLIAFSPLLRGMYDPARSARLLFSTNVFVAYRSGLDRQTLSVLDEGRPLAVKEAEQGTYTLWKHRGVQFQLRESGIPRAAVSTDTRCCPHFSAELMQAAMPLVLHEHPHRVLLLGLGGGVPLETCLSFPVEELTCVEGDRHLIELVQNRIWKRLAANPAADDRLRLLQLDPALAVLCADAEYDVIISSPQASALMRATPYFTVEFYTRAADRLAEDGIFCQRFQQIDYGSWPLRIAARTIQAAFDNVAAVETASGEMILLATNSSKGLTREKLVERLQAPHVRRVLSQAGWDWSVALNLTAYGDTVLAEFARDGAAGMNTAGNGRFAFRLPQEVMRWGSKWQDLQQQLWERRERILEWVGDDGEDPDVLRRLSEVAGQRKLMTVQPDEWWVYRKTVRDQLKSHPRTLIQQVGHERPKHALHPEEKRRLRYFAALSKAVECEPPRSEDIRRVAEFAAPYDPLISYFLHQEVAALYARAGDRDPGAEFVHRLHAIHFADSRDRSVRNVAEALTLLLEYPETVADPSERWDHLNSLLQVLKLRWEARASTKPSSAGVALIDIEKSISAAETSFEAMDELTGRVNVPPDEWQARKDYLERTLVRPLRTYRDRILPHHRRTRKK